MNNTEIIQIEEITDQEAMVLCGPSDRYLHILSECTGRDISCRDTSFFVRDCTKEDAEMLRMILEQLVVYIQRGRSISEQDVIYVTRMAQSGKRVDLEALHHKLIGRTQSGRAIVPKTLGQLQFAEAMEEASITFAIGPAGTGKTFLAVTAAVSAMKRGDIRRIVLTRPAVEAGENLGFLPGDLKEKVDPYLTPLYDALHDMLGAEQTERLMEKGTIEVAPLAYMRGRTLDDAFIILDEAQNTTVSQMKMFLTRLGFHSRMVITGDITQIDLDRRQESGLVQAARILRGMKEIRILEFTPDDVVRHPLVQKIIERYAEES